MKRKSIFIIGKLLSFFLVLFLQNCSKDLSSESITYHILTIYNDGGCSDLYPIIKRIEIFFIDDGKNIKIDLSLTPGMMKTLKLPVSGSGHFKIKLIVDTRVSQGSITWNDIFLKLSGQSSISFAYKWSNKEACATWGIPESPEERPTINTILACSEDLPLCN